MAVQFYLNDCLPATSCKDIHNVFCEFLKSFTKLATTQGLDVSGWYIEGSYAILKVCSVPISRIVEQIPDRDLKQAALNIFARANVIDVLLTDSEISDDSDIYAKAEFNGLDATNLLVAAKSDLISASIPVADFLKQDQLAITISSDDGIHEMRIDNWYGENSTYILDKYIPNPEDGSLDKLIAVFGRDKSVYVSDEFSNDWGYLGHTFHETIIKRFKTALDHGLLFPASADDEIVKYDRNATNVYELRHIPMGWRIYFECDEDKIFIGRYATKSNPKGCDQSADFNRTSHIIASMRTSVQKYKPKDSR